MRAIARSQVSRQYGVAEPECRSYRLAPADEPDGDNAEQRSSVPLSIEREHLPYKVELWDKSRASVERVLALTANASIGYAAYYAATREHPHRYVTLRHKNRIVSRWNGPQH